MLNEETRNYILKHADEDVRKLALKMPADDRIDVRMALQQIEGRQIARKKLPAWSVHQDILFPPRLSLEQCSSEITALYKQALVKRLLNGINKDKGEMLVDLTGGLGIDFSYLAPLFARAVYMERQHELCLLARHNMNVLGLDHAEVIETDSSVDPVSWPKADICFVDPARRDTAGRKTVAISDCEPDLSRLQDRLREKMTYCVFKLSPLLDIRLAMKELEPVSEIHVVSVQNECKELLLVMDSQPVTQPVKCHCVNLKPEISEFVFTYDEEQAEDCAYTSDISTYLYEPNASILKAGAFRSIGRQYDLLKLHPNSHLYTSDRLVGSFPGRTFMVDGCSAFARAEVKKLLGGVTQANMTIRNFPSDVAALRKRLRLKEGGNVYLFVTTLANGQHVIIKTHKIPET